jgi:methylphosphotriester-DNA--protein-cysteine methyltransferase
MDYREHPVPEPFRRHLACLWQLHDPTPSGEAQTIYPDGCCEIIVHLGTAPQGWDAQRGWHAQAPTLFAAQHLGAVRLLATRPLHCLGLRLHPDASTVLGAGTMVRDRILDLAALDAALSRALRRAARAFVAGEPAALWRLVATRLAHSPVDALVADAVARLRDSGGTARIGSLARELGLGTRALQLRFRRRVALTPKEFARVMRLRATLRALDVGDAPLAELAADQGFADQAHASRELRRVTGLAPARLRAALRKDRGGDSAVRLAAAFVRGYA